MEHEFENSRVYLMDCMEGMSKYPDNHFELAVVDPPYGIGIDGQKESICKNLKHNRKEHIKKDWDTVIPDINYFNELRRVSVNQIIWGANYFVNHLEESKKGWLIWYKGQKGLTMSDAELAYSSFDTPTRLFELNRGYISKHGGSVHPTQKPVKLYDWIFKNYAKEGDKILDTHLGSQSSRISAYKNGLDFTGYELDEDYFRDGNKRFTDFTNQLVLI